ncbi:MAG: TetR family transcriptional regulator [Acidobacteriota bacterium]|nr:TetR family transcriptional regulator [Acidobacteriota bacterium]
MSAETKDRILDAAENLFADSGFPATSMRDITKAAKVNLAAINYHFGSKEALLIAVLERTTTPVNRHRLERLDELEATAVGGAAVEPEQLVRAFLTPLFEQHSKWTQPNFKWLKLLGRIHTEVDSELRAKLASQFDSVFGRFSEAMQRSVPEVEANKLLWRGLFLLGSMSFTMTWGAAILSAEPRPEPAEILEELIHFTAAGISAPSTKSVKK